MPFSKVLSFQTDSTRNAFRSKTIPVISVGRSPEQLRLRQRSAIDPLFRSAAVSHGRAVVGVVLTGSLDDGTAGLMVVYARGGEAIVQDPATAMFASMPASAVERVPHAHVLPLSEIPDLIVHLVEEEIPELKPVNNGARTQAGKETRIAEFDMSQIENENRPGHPSQFACPDCGGVLWELDDNNLLRYRCRVGHAFTARHLGAEQRNSIEAALWSALRALEENASLYRRMAEKSVSAGVEKRFEERAEDVSANARVLREFLLHVNQESEERLVLEEE